MDRGPDSLISQSMFFNGKSLSEPPLYGFCIDKVAHGQLKELQSFKIVQIIILYKLLATTRSFSLHSFIFNLSGPLDFTEYVFSRENLCLSHPCMDFALAKLCRIPLRKLSGSAHAKVAPGQLKQLQSFKIMGYYISASYSTCYAHFARVCWIKRGHNARDQAALHSYLLA